MKRNIGLFLFNVILIISLMGMPIQRTASAAQTSPNAPAGTALQFNGSSQYVTFGDTKMVRGTLTGTPTWNTSANSKLGASSLAFNGTSQYVTFGAAPELNATNFTLEAWFYWQGGGTTGTTGGGGLTAAIPLVTKGRDQADGSNVDANYYLGIQGGKLAADFEDMASGANHPIVGGTTITTNSWHHAAVTYDSVSAVWTLYLDGVADGTLDLGSDVLPRYDSIQYSAIGSSQNSTGGASGYFQGRIDEVRIWNITRTQTEIQNSMNSEILTPTSGLLGRWGLNDGSGGTASNLNRLGVTSFTLEAWIKRASGGVPMTTGGLGFDGGGGRPNGAYPVLAKGMGEGETPANINTNWFLGITADGFVGADFEDTAGGINHPAWGTTSVPLNQWHHIAATYTGSCWLLYIDGSQDPLNALVTGCPGATPESTSYQHAGLSAGINSSGGLGTGYFSGVIDEARVWNRALDASEILANKNLELTSGTGLVARWGLNDSTGTIAVNSIGGSPNGTLSCTGTNCTLPLWVAGFPDNVPPAAPSGLTATGIDGGISLTWAAPADTDLAGYHVYRSLSSPVDSTTPLASLVPGLSYTDNSVVASTTYYYVVKAVDTSGNKSAASNEDSAVPLAGTPPSAPTGLTATGTSFSLVTLNWTDNSNNETGFEVYRSTTGIDGAYTLLTTAAADAITYPNSGLIPVTEYCYKVRAINGTGPSDFTTSQCATTPAEPSSALQFNGSNQYVTFGPTIGLGLTNFTLEAWIKRTGIGVTASTGSSGCIAIPIISKGLHESDGGTQDANYFLGIDPSTNKLCADFEDYNNGTNHPVSGGSGSIPADSNWHHVAVTYDQPTGIWNLYIDGNPDSTLTITGSALVRTPRYDSAQHAGIATAMNTSGTAEGGFAGIIDEVRIWNVARTQTEIRATINQQVTTGTGLVARWGLSEGIGATFTYSSVGSFPGELKNGPTWVAGAPFNIAPPTAPAAPTLLAATSTAGLQINLAWTDNSDNETSFKVERSPDGSTSWSQIGTTVTNISTYSDGELNPATQYCYRVRASNSVGDSDNSNVSCATTPGEPNNGLNFGSNNTYATFGNPPTLGLTQFTLETWFKRTGTGVFVTTGSGGITNAIPLLTKGTSDVDNHDNRDFNYFLGINADSNVLIADFEEGAGGTSPSLNHPVSGTTAIVLNTWYHAVATYDGTTFKLYLNGNLEGTLTVGQPPRNDNTSPVSIATSIKNDGTTLTPQGYFNGVMDEVRIWNYARTQSDIQGTMNSPITSPQTGLVARWGLNETTGTAVPSSAGTSVNGTVTGTGFSWGAGSSAVVNHSPVFVSGTPSDGATNVPISTPLIANVSDADLDNLTVQFFGRPKADDFTIIALPDTQTYSNNTTYPDHSVVFNSQTTWIVNNASTRNIAFVTHLGDIVNTGGTAAEWTRAVAAMSMLDSAGIPYGMTVGNHDQNPYSTPGSTAEFNANFGISHFIGRPYYGGHYGDTKNDNNFELFTAGGMDFIIIHLEYNDSMDPAVVTWANNLLQTNSDRRAIVVTHNLLNGTTPTTQANAIWNGIKDNPNLFLMLGGHQDQAGQTSLTGTNGNTVYLLRSDYQTLNSGSSGYLRIMNFRPQSNEIFVETYSPYLTPPGTLTDGTNQFTLDYTMSGSPFVQIGTDQIVTSGSGSASITWSGLDPNKEYEWYTTISDGVHSIMGSTSSFTTAAPTSVSLVDFNTTSTPQAIQLDWQSAQEIALLGFNIYRSESIDGSQIMLNTELIPAVNPGQLQGNSYQYLDATAETSQVYFYWLEWVGTTGTEMFGPISASSSPYRLYLPLGLR